MDDVQIHYVIILGFTSPLVNFVTFMFLAPQKWRHAIVVGVMSLFCTRAYMTVIVVIYQVVFSLMKGLPGA